MDERFISVKELADFFGISADRAYKICKNKDFPALRVGGKILIEKTILENEWIPNQINQKEEK